jgi:hypothetical protein
MGVCGYALRVATEEMAKDMRALRTLSSREIVERVAANHLLFKAAGEVLQEREPDDAAGMALVQSYRGGVAPAWMTAHLLGCLRAECGYDTVREILLAAPGLLAESYAGVAMARIRGLRARSDLVALMGSAAHLQSREGAAYGVGILRDPALVPVVYDAFHSGSLRKLAAASIIRNLDVSTATVTAWLRSTDERDRSLGVEIAFFMEQIKSDQAFAQTVKAALNTVSLSPSRRKRIEEKLG